MPFFEMMARLLDGVWLLLSHVAGRSSFPKPLSRERERETVERMIAGESKARDELIEHNLRLVAHIAKKYLTSGIDNDDLVSIGTIGLIKAVDSFKPESGKLATYASRCIDNEILMALRSNRKNRCNVSFSDPIGRDKEDNEVTLLDILGTPGDIVADEAELNIDARKAIEMFPDVLTEREHMVVAIRYGIADGIPHPQHEVARALGISRSYVSRIEKRAIEKLNEALTGGVRREEE